MPLSNQLIYIVMRYSRGFLRGKMQFFSANSHLVGALMRLLYGNPRIFLC
ncbi:hypothetical protein PULV_a2423 [Pseudoalteromonas ulvae UL12]|nr:hypothetical protein [Pseudoalteromonas ulvae UL12]